MADRLLQVARHDDMRRRPPPFVHDRPRRARSGASRLRLRHRLDDAAPPVRDAMRYLLATAAAFEDNAHGRAPQGIQAAGRTLDDALVRHNEEDWRLLTGLIEQLELTLERQANVMAERLTPAPAA